MQGPYMGNVKDYVEEICPECGGDGFLVEFGTCIACLEPPERLVMCPTCEGTGVVITDAVLSTGEEPDDDELELPPIEVYDAMEVRV